MLGFASNDIDEYSAVQASTAAVVIASSAIACFTSEHIRTGGKTLCAWAYSKLSPGHTAPGAELKFDETADVNVVKCPKSRKLDRAVTTLKVASSASKWARRRKSSIDAEALRLPPWQVPRLSTTTSAPIAVHVLRLRPGDDIIESLRGFAAARGITAGCVISCVGSTARTTLMPPGANSKERVFGDDESTFDIVSLVGTFSANAHHLHMSIAGPDCVTYGGHVLPGCVVHTAVEIVVGQLGGGICFGREHDSQSGQKELYIYQKRLDIWG